MNRRHFLAGSLALAGSRSFPQGAAAPPDPKPVNDPGDGLPGAPHDLLGTTYSREYLEQHLVGPGAWHPYPTAEERGAWAAVPDDISRAIIARAGEDQRAGWRALLATRFLDFRRDGNRSRYESESFGRRAMLARLVLAECLEAKGRFTDEIANGVWLICEETFWGAPAHLGAQRAGVGLPDVSEPIIELFSAETAATLALASYLLGPQLDRVSPLINRRIRLETERRILAPARERSDFSWMGLDPARHRSRLNNWNPWINSNLLVANLILESDRQHQVEETLRIVRSTDAYLNDFWPDGGEEEGPGYFSRSVLSLFEVVSGLESATGGRSSIFRSPSLDRMGRFILDAHIAGDDYVAYGDAHRHAAPPGDVLYRLGRALGDPELAAFGSFQAARSGWSARGPGLESALRENLTGLARSVPAVLEAGEVRGAPRQDVLVRDAWYPAFGLMTARERAGTAEGMYVAVLAANNGRSHSHNDTGSFVVYLDGQPVAIDVGVEAYTAKTFSSGRYSIWTMQSAFHNLPTVGGVMQHEGAGYTAAARRYESSDRLARVSFEIARAYPEEAGIRSWIRTVTLDRERRRVVVEESFELERAQAVSLTVMTPGTPGETDGGMTIGLAGTPARACTLSWDRTVLTPDVETIALSDGGLRASWGESIHRILLKTPNPVRSGTLRYIFAPAE